MAATPDPLKALSAAGVAVWLDDLDRTRLTSGGLAELVRDKSVVGVTTNPSIFQKALSNGEAYAGQVRDLAVRGVDLGEAVRAITSFDVRTACDVFRPVYDATDALDGRVSIEVDPRIAHDTAFTVAEARALWWQVDRPNLFIKIPATKAGLPAISQALAEGISVNVTLIFSLDRYAEVMDAYLSGLERRLASGGELRGLESVASFFVSRVDTEVDARLGKIATPAAKALRGKAAIANARLAYQAYARVFSSDRWLALAAKGARPQRPLWASTGVKDPAYDDTRYVVDLVAPGVVNTMPEATLNAVEDHGQVPGDSVTGTYAEARQVLDELAAVGVDYDEVVALLEVEGVEKFEVAWSGLLESLTASLKAAKADA
ncbi:MAG TPA: transaldolase [Mycobacteriales bacterium]|jgi:transaldolase|nr:transaldolase [Mycobacteriales bacterium]